MKHPTFRGLLRLAAFLLGLALIVAFANTFCIKTDIYAALTMAEVKTRSDIEVAFVGSSIVRDHFNAALISEQTGRKAFSAAVPGLSLQGELALTRELYRQNSPEYTVLVVEPYNFNTAKEDPNAFFKLSPFLSGIQNRLTYFMDACREDGDYLNRLFLFREFGAESPADVAKTVALRLNAQSEYARLRPTMDSTVAYAGGGFLRHTSGESAETLLESFRLDDEISTRLSRLYGYASCKGDQDTGDNYYQDMRGKAMSTYVAIASAAAYRTSEIMAIPEDTLNLFYTVQPELETYRRSLYQIRRRAAHILSPKEETLLAAAGEMADSPESIGSVFRNAELRFPEVEDKDGVKHQLTNGSFVPLLESSDRVLRRNAFETYYNRLGEYKNTIAATLDAQFKQLRFFAGARKYETTLAASLDATEVPVEVYLNLIDAVHANMDKMYKYVALRKKLLGVDELHMYDVYTPIVADADSEITYEEAKATVLEALAVLGEDYTDLLKEGFANRWIDVYENTGKRGGAYSSGNSYPHPYVLLNHKDNLDSMFTLAHEMGHALHSYHSCKYQPVNTAGYVIFVAEVASTCNEVLLMRHLLGKTTDKKQRAYLINHFLDQFKGTVYRQTMFAEFEKIMGEMNGAGEALTADALSEKYLALNKLYFGPDMVSDDGIALEWARIPHFFYNYYVFQYATGFSAAVAIANRILAEGEPAVADYKKFLSSGGSADPISLLKIAGVDMSTPKPVNDALALFGELIDEMERLAD